MDSYWIHKSFWKYNYGFLLDNVIRVEPVYGIPGKLFFFLPSSL